MKLNKRKIINFIQKASMGGLIPELKLVSKDGNLWTQQSYMKCMNVCQSAKIDATEITDTSLGIRSSTQMLNILKNFEEDIELKVADPFLRIADSLVGYNYKLAQDVENFTDYESVSDWGEGFNVPRERILKLLNFATLGDGEFIWFEIENKNLTIKFSGKEDTGDMSIPCEYRDLKFCMQLDYCKAFFNNFTGEEINISVVETKQEGDNTNVTMRLMDSDEEETTTVYIAECNPNLEL